MLRVHELDKEMSGEDRFHLENISFHLPKGYICGLVGENGAGKTTLLRCLMGLYRSTGDIVIDGHNLNSDEAAAREVIAVVGDEGFFDENINLEKLGKYYGQMYVRFDMEKYLGYLERFNLDRKQKYKKLSKGMKIKAQLAFALSYGAKLFLFDEPTAGLDKHFREDFLRLCTELVSDGEKSIIISSHITEDLDRIADYIAYMQAGRLLFFKPKDAACEHFRIVTGPVYKCKLIPREAVVYMEEGTYSSTAMVIRDKCILVDRELQEHTPDIRELIHYLVKGGRKMPKILWKNILDSSRRELVLAIVMIPLFWLGITEGSFGGLNQVMYIYNLMISIFSIFSNHNRSAFELPQYMYLAPYSREQRQHYIQKMFKYRFRVSYIVLLLPILITAIIRPDKTLTVSGIVYYMCEMLVMAGISYFTSFDNYLGSVNPGRLTIFDVIMFMSAVVVAASYDQNDSSLDLVQILISLVIGVFFISMIVSCRKKYYDDIVRCMADYEFAESKKDKKIA